MITNYFIYNIKQIFVQLLLVGKEIEHVSYISYKDEKYRLNFVLVTDLSIELNKIFVWLTITVINNQLLKHCASGYKSAFPQDSYKFTTRTWSKNHPQHETKPGVMRQIWRSPTTAELQEQKLLNSLHPWRRRATILKEINSNYRKLRVDSATWQFLCAAHHLSYLIVILFKTGDFTHWRNWNKSAKLYLYSLYVSVLWWNSFVIALRSQSWKIIFKDKWSPY